LAFTLIELLAMVSVLGIMAIAIASSMANTRPSTAGLVCMNNLRQLGSAWKMYADDSGGNLVYNTDGTQSGTTASNPSWVGGWLDYSSSPDNTNTALLVNHTLYPYAAHFGPYLKDATVFKCPADGSFAKIAGHSYHRVRSYSMNNTFGPGSRMWTLPSAFTHHLTLSDVKHPSQLFIIIEEHNGSINDGCFFSDPDTAWQIVDFPAAYHNSASNLVFVDGHAEQHRWVNPWTIPVAPPGTLIPLNENLPGDLDVAWLQQHAAERP
jgi:prepilin-type processing-associated H-X9-DG protein